MKLKLNTSISMPPPESPAPAAATPGGTKLTLKFSQPPTPAPSSTVQTPKGSKKKRKAEDGETGSAAKKAKASNLPAAAAKPQILRLKSAKDTPTTAATQVKFNFKGKAPPRPLGVGYDSEAEEAEIDPAIEESIVLRMKPGPDCDLVRKALEDRTFGLPRSDGGVQVAFRFFGKDGRRAAVTVQDRVYAAVLLDLPCIVESMKSWDKRGWWKSADICQMLLVLDAVNTPEDSKNLDLPPYIDQKTWQWPHGLTPPMHNARKRRFRKRISYRTIEAAENEVERLLAEDERIENLPNGETHLELMDLDEMRQGEDLDEDADGDDDAEGDFDDSQLIQPQEEEEDLQAMEDRLAEQFAEWDDDDDEASKAATTNGDASTSNGEVTVHTADIADAGIAPTNGRPSEEAPSSDALPDTATAETPEAEEEEDDEDDDEEDDGSDDDETARGRAQEEEHKREDIRQLEASLKQTQQKLANVQNPIFQKRFIEQIQTLEAELEIKRRAAGELEDDE